MWRVSNTEISGIIILVRKQNLPKTNICQCAYVHVHISE